MKDIEYNKDFGGQKDLTECKEGSLGKYSYDSLLKHRSELIECLKTIDKKLKDINSSMGTKSDGGRGNYCKYLNDQ